MESQTHQVDERGLSMVAGKKTVPVRPPDPLLIVLHIGPGIVFAATFFILSNILTPHGLSSYLLLLIAIPLCLVPMELGVMVFWGARGSGTNSLSHAVGYLRDGTKADYTGLPLFLLLCCMILPIGATPITQFLEGHMPGWFPMWAGTGEVLRGLESVSKAQRTITLICALLFSGFAAPIVEELYFRGFLLSRTEHWGPVAPLVNSLLFGLYHVFAPWNVVAIFLVFLPIAYAVWIRKNVRIAIVTHCLFNLLNVALLFSRLRPAP